MSDFLELKNVSLRSGKIPLLKDVSMSLEKGKILCVAGESGSGKSMTCLAIMQLLNENIKFTNGEIFFEGKNLLAMSDKEMEDIRGHEIGMIMQNPIIAFNPIMDIGSHFAETMAAHFKTEKKEAEAIAIDYLKKLNLPADEMFLRKYPFQLSGGQLQRVMIAIALSGKAKLLLADEPTTALDVTVQKQILDEMIRIKNEYDTSIILVTHNLNILSYLADEIVVMYYGEIVEKASKDEFFQNPLHPYTISLMHSQPRMDTVRLDPIPGQPPLMGSLDENMCAFYDRCQMKTDECKSKKIGLQDKNGHLVRCWRV